MRVVRCAPCDGCCVGSWELDDVWCVLCVVC